MCVAANQVDSDTAGVTDGASRVATSLTSPLAATSCRPSTPVTPTTTPPLARAVTEPFTVTQATPTLATALSAGTAAIGAPVTDTASLAGATTNAGGTVTYAVYIDSACTTPASTSQISAQPPAVTVTARGGARLGAGEFPGRGQLLLAGGLLR